MVFPSISSVRIFCRGANQTNAEASIDDKKSSQNARCVSEMAATHEVNADGADVAVHIRIVLDEHNKIRTIHIHRSRKRHGSVNHKSALRDGVTHGELEQVVAERTNSQTRTTMFSASSE